MKNNEQDTPPSSINGDELEIDDEEMIYLGHLDELNVADEDLDDYVDDDMDEEPPEDHAAVVFDKHIGSVFCCDLHPNGKLAVTGGEDDKAYVWNVETGELVLDCQGFKDSVIFVGFSFDGAYLGTADMMGVIKVWECKTNETWPLVFEYETGDVNFGLWHFGARVLFCGTEGGQIYVFKIPSGDTKVLQSNNVKVECGKVFPDGTRLAAGYNDGSIKVWDIKSEKVLHSIQMSEADNQVTDIDTHPDNNVMASISDDGKIIVTLSSGKTVGHLQTEENLECISFSKDADIGYLASGTLNGSLVIWDVARQMPRNHCSKSEDSVGVIKLSWVKDKLISVCLDGSIRIYNGRSGDRLALLTGHRSEILDFCHNIQQNLILTVSDDGTARIYKYDFNKENP